MLPALVHALTGRSLPPGLAPVDSTVRCVKVAEFNPDLFYQAQQPVWALVEVQHDIEPDKQRR